MRQSPCAMVAKMDGYSGSMLSKWGYIAVVMLLFTAEAGAQELRILSRAALDSLVNPTLSTTALKAISAEPATRNMGEVLDSERANTYFTLHNTTDKAIEVTKIHSSCGCLKVASKITHIAAGESVTLRAEFNPAGRNGSFSIPIFVYTSLDEQQPTLRLTIEGRVIATDEWSHLPIRMGSLRMSRNIVTFDSATRTERIAMANVGDKPITIYAEPTLEGIVLRSEPEILAPGMEGDIVISYATQAEPTHDIETAIIVEGCGAIRPSERVIKIVIKR